MLSWLRNLLLFTLASSVFTQQTNNENIQRNETQNSSSTIIHFNLELKSAGASKEQNEKDSLKLADTNNLKTNEPSMKNEVTASTPEKKEVTTSTTEKNAVSSSSTEKSVVSMKDLEDSFGGAAITQPGDSELPPPKKNGFYWMVDWNSFLEVGDGDSKVNIRFEPKLGDPQMFLPS